MKPIEPPELHYVKAAQGWLELGNPIEAEAELERIKPPLQEHPAVLHVRWELTALARQWESALALAAKLINLDPDEPLGWVHKSYALHELKRTREARDNLLEVVERFPGSATLRYNLACYECQLGHLNEAKEWLQKALQLADPNRMKAAALHDPDLERLWPEIANF